MERNPGADDDDRLAIVHACREMLALGLTQGTSGNISTRTEGGILITPSGLAYADMLPEDIVFMRWDGRWEAPRGVLPSSEWRFHLGIMREKPETNAVVHTHAPYCSIVAIMGQRIPAIHYMIAAAGGNDIPCAPYAQFGTDALTDHILHALRNRRACLLAHHGMLAVGSSLARALWLAVEVEMLARQYHGCAQIGTPPTLPDAEIESILVRWGEYGPRTKSIDA